MDEYLYLLGKAWGVSGESKKTPLKNILKEIDTVLSLQAGIPRYYSGSEESQGNILRCHYAMHYGDDETKYPAERGESESSPRLSDMRAAFNSPFWPFVLSTTSIGQEGLDFHRYCSNVVHWNLPWNPVDLEQREGRVNRYDSMVVRENIAKDIVLSDITARGNTENLWDLVFNDISTRMNLEDQLKQGIAPHWIYFSKKETENHGICRHVASYVISKEFAFYETLTKYLALYRLALGQPQQEEFMKLAGQIIERLGRRRVRGHQFVPGETSGIIDQNPILRARLRDIAVPQFACVAAFAAHHRAARSFRLNNGGRQQMQERALSAGP